MIPSVRHELSASPSLRRRTRPVPSLPLFAILLTVASLNLVTSSSSHLLARFHRCLAASSGPAAPMQCLRDMGVVANTPPLDPRHAPDFLPEWDHDFLPVLDHDLDAVPTLTVRSSYYCRDDECRREAASFVARVAAAFGEHAILSEVLAEHGGAALAHISRETGWNALHEAAAGGHLSTVRLLVEEYGVSINATTSVEMECEGIECIGRNGRVGNGATAAELAAEIWGTAETEPYGEGGDGGRKYP
eukprot:CAMPEP_0194270588 /NCGR_PEP_ID=MMETSP0169-20130528/4548_1 /TAXON_ID=218684 /ORGANISM="Corethron pennatum, Strain L29A3" /LENGTH=246 /DNA_ID=CAMNT_0039012687 /DNA_START=73 /DNA_END=810 /DNA_ORIENTATION=-